MTIKRAIALGGGGPTVGLALGVLKRLSESPEITFDVWSLSCIGSWLGSVYVSSPEGEGYGRAEEFFRHAMQTRAVYDRFPVARIFAPDFLSYVPNLTRYLTDPKTWNNLVLPDEIMEATGNLMRAAFDPGQWTHGGLNKLILNNVMAVNPITRMMCSLAYDAPVLGLSRYDFPDTPGHGLGFDFDVEGLFGAGKPLVYHNAYNLTNRRLDLFVNRRDHPAYKPIEVRTLMAGSALPYIVEPVDIDGTDYCEGATIDPVNFRDLIDNHPDLDEIWVVRLLSRNQVKKPRNLSDALNNLVMLFAASASEDAVTLLRFVLQERRSRMRVIEVPVSAEVSFDWTHDNLDRGIAAGYRQADRVIGGYKPRAVLAASFGALNAITRRATDQADSDDTASGSSPAGNVPGWDEFAGIAAHLPAFTAQARNVCEGKPLSSTLRDLLLGFTTDADALQDAIEVAVANTFDAAKTEDCRTALDALAALRRIGSDLNEMVATLIARSHDRALLDYLLPLVDATEASLFALGDALSGDAEDAEMLKVVSGQRHNVMRTFRGTYLNKDNVDGQVRAALLVITGLFEAIAAGIEQFAGILTRPPMSVQAAAD